MSMHARCIWPTPDDRRQHIATLAKDHRAWRNLMVACYEPMDDDDGIKVSE